MKPNAHNAPDAVFPESRLSRSAWHWLYLAMFLSVLPAYAPRADGMIGEDFERPAGLHDEGLVRVSDAPGFDAGWAELYGRTWVQSNSVAEGSRALAIAGGSGMEFSASNRENVVWVSMELGVDPWQGAPIVPLETLSAYVFAGTNGFWALDGNGSGGGTFVELGIAPDGSFQQVQIGLDYSNQTYEVWVNGVQRASGLGFKDSALTNFSHVTWESGTTLYLDSVHVSPSRIPPPLFTTDRREWALNVGQAFEAELQAVNDPLGFRVSDGALPSGIALDESTGRLSGIPSSTGIVEAVVVATNGVSVSPGQSLVFDIGATNATPRITSPLLVDEAMGRLVSVQLRASHAATNFVVQSAPSWLSVDSASGLLRGYPTATGVSTVQVSAVNANGVGSSTNLHVRVRDAEPLAICGTNGLYTNTFSLLSGERLTSWSSGAPDPDMFTYTGKLPPGVFLDAWSGRIAGVPSWTGSYTSHVGTAYRHADATSGAVVVIINVTGHLDLDGDGLPDVWEEAYGLSTGSGAGTNGPNGNADGDLLDNEAEFIAGTDPTDPTSFFQGIVIPHDEGDGLGFEARPNRCYRVMGCTNLIDQTWVVVVSNYLATGGVYVIEDSAGYQHRFYRMKVRTEPWLP